MTTHIKQLRSILRSCRWMPLALCALLLVPHTLLAQPELVSSGPVPPAPTAGGEAPTLEAASTGDSNPPVTTCSPEYWIISTRSSTKQIECGQACNYEIFRFNNSNSPYASSLNELTSSLQPGVPVCFMAHGSFVTWDSMLKDSACTNRWLRSAAPCQPMHLIFYTWSSEIESCLPHLHVNRMGRRATLNGFYLADLISKISLDHPICLIGHSHGTRMVAAALHSMAGGTVSGRQLANGPHPIRRIRVVFAAAAIDHNWLNPDERFGLALCPAESVLNLKNQHDFPLLFYPLRRPFATQALAITGVTRSDRRELGAGNQKIVDYNVTELVGLGHIWSHYYERPEIASLIRPYVFFDDMPNVR